MGLGRPAVLHMAGGGGDGPVRVHGHDVQVREGEDLGKGTQLAVHQVQQLLGLGGHVGLHIAVGPAVAVGPGVGHGDEVDVLHLQPAEIGGLREPQDILEAQVRLHVLLEDLGELVDLADVLQLQKLAHHGLEEGLLGLDAPQVPVGIAPHVAVLRVIVAVAEHLHGVLACEQAVALRLVDGEVLVGVVVVHILGHVKPDAAHGLHDLAHGLPLHHHLVVRLEAHQLGDLLVEGLDTLVAASIGIIDGIDPFDVPGDVHHGVPGDGHDGGLLVGDIIAREEHGVGVPAAAGIPPQDQDGVEVLALALPVRPGADAVSVVDALGAGAGGAVLRGLCGQGGLHEGQLPGNDDDQRHRQHGSRGDEPLLLFGKGGTLGLFAALRPLSVISLFHWGRSFPCWDSRYFRAARVAEWTGLPRWCISSTVMESPMARPRSRSS